MEHHSNRRRFLGMALGAAAGSAAPATVHAGEDAAAGPEAVAQALEDARRRSRASQLEEQAAYGKALIARFGPAVVDVVRETTVSRARGWTERAGVRRDLEEVQTLLWDTLGPDFEYEVVERSPERVRYKVTRCPYAEQMRALDAAELGFAYNCAFDVGFCEGLNPGIRFTRTRTLMEGHDHCDHTYELPSGSASAAAARSQGSDENR